MGRRLRRGSSDPKRTPSSGPRINPFDSHLSTDRLLLPTCSPSVFSIVVSPSQEASTSGRFWSLDQQAHLFPAQISDDSPWKQEMAVSRLDPEMEDKTQEAIDLYFSQHHKVTSPEELPSIARTVSLNNRSVAMESVGNSPNLSCATSKSSREVSSVQESEPMKEDEDNADNSGSNSAAVAVCTQWTQTCLSFPPILPPEVEDIIATYSVFHEVQNNQPKPIMMSGSSLPVGGQRNNSVPPLRLSLRAMAEEGNLSASTLRRKLFAGMVEDDDDDNSDCDERSKPHEEDKENIASTVMSISPGKVILTPTATKVPSPNRSLSWSLSPVSRKREVSNVGTPIGSSTPTK